MPLRKTKLDPLPTPSPSEEEAFIADSEMEAGLLAGERGVPGSDPYLLETVSRACEVLKCFKNNEESLKLRDIVQRTGLNKTIAFRIVHTLSEHGLLERTANLGYKPRLTLMASGRFRIGYAAQAEESSFSAAVTAGIRLAAARHDIDLVFLDNCYSAAIALKNAQKLAASRVDLVLDCQTHTKIAPAVSAIFREVGIPLIAIEIPHPNATFYGADNYRTGLLAGQVLGRWAKNNWDGKVDQVLLLEAEAAGPLPQLRLAGARAGVRAMLPSLPDRAFVSLEARWDFLRAFEAVRKYLRRTQARKTLITGINDVVVLGALRAFEEVGRSQDCVAVCLGAIPEARAELRRKGSRLIGAVAFFPERYGEDIIRTALDILHHREVPPAVYAHHELLTANNVSKLYPIDVPQDLRSSSAMGDLR
jgi:ribose transport system substrate-binding protein